MDASRLLGIPLRRAHRYWHGDVPILQADDLAVKAGAHPLELWGRAWPLAWQAFEDQREARRERTRRRKRDSNRLSKPTPKSGWDEIERSWRQWRAQRERFEYDRQDRQADQA